MELIKTITLRKQLLFLFVMLLTLPTFGQAKKKVPNLRGFDEKRLHFGFLVGLNTMDFLVHNTGEYLGPNNERLYADVLHLKPGINIGIVSSLRLRKNLNLRFLPGITFGQRDLYYKAENFSEDDTEDIETNPLTIKSTFLEFPFLIKYSGQRMHNAKPYLIGGVNFRYDLAKNVQDRLLLRSLDEYLEFGVGFDFYMTYFRLSMEAKASIGFANMLNINGTGEEADQMYTDALNGLKSRIFQLTFYFE